MESMKRIARITLGLILLIYGANHFFENFLGLTPMPAEAQNILVSMGYWLMYVKLFEMLVAIALLTNRFVPLALIVLAPISINILAFHILYDPRGILPGLIVALLTVFLIYQNFDFYRPFLQRKAHLK
ncbi:MAG: hypothetical protein V2I46_06590 [Bacteroides sp.]|jgi:uncharacterized membrane protein YphA (DoxX/SURF4 family)|nr:hypothetical protein [Bacteroides sp.]